MRHPHRLPRLCALLAALVMPLAGGTAAAATPTGGSDVTVGLAVNAPAALVGRVWLGAVRDRPALAPPAPPALAAWLAAQAGVPYTPVWTPRGVAALGPGPSRPVPDAHGTPAIWPLGGDAPRTGPALTLAPVPGTFDGSPYRGTLSARIGSAGVTVVNRLSIESYLRGVVPAEVFPSWPAAALEAQAVAARTFTVRNLGRRAALGFDLYADTRDQAYGGEAAETPATDAAIRETAGLILTHGGQPIDAVYSASAGGVTASGQEVWGRPVPYLPSRPLPEEPPEPWAVLLPAGPILQAFPALGGSLRSAAPGSPSASGRVRDIVLTGAGGTVRVTISALARAADPGGGIRSSLLTVAEVVPETDVVGTGAGSPLTFTGWSGAAPAVWSLLGSGPPLQRTVTAYGLYLAGRGFGHGAGLSQWGAYALATRGWSFRRILAYFYPGTRLSRLPN